MESKACFGVLKKVFPAGERGLREVPADCLECPDRVPCLRQALKTKDGLKMQEERLGLAEASGMIGRLTRWSRKKELSRRIKEHEEK